MGLGKQNRRALFQTNVAEELVSMLQKCLLHRATASISFVERVNTSTSARRSSGRVASRLALYIVGELMAYSGLDAGPMLKLSM